MRTEEKTIKKKPLELYVHIPFCIRKCAYCDFVSGPAGEREQERYQEALKKEIAAAEAAKEYEVSSVFIGGGTPSVIRAEYLREILQLFRKKYLFREDAEITLEANPGTLTREKLEIYQEAGFNRISLGCQSTQDDELKRLGRIHTFAQFQESFRMAREAGFSDINVDLMSGLPGQTKKSWEQSLRTIAEMGTEHISAYSLIVEPGTPFAKQKLDLPEEEVEREMYEQTAEILREYGLFQYEISNYAKEGFACSHNMGYWMRRDYLGFGRSAASLFENCRWTNTADAACYETFSGQPEKIRKEQEILSTESQMEEFMFLGLRMTKGVSEAEFSKNFGKTMHSVYGPVLEKYSRMHLLQEENGRVFLTRTGISVSNVILADFLL